MTKRLVWGAVAAVLFTFAAWAGPQLVTDSAKSKSYGAVSCTTTAGAIPTFVNGQAVYLFNNAAVGGTTVYIGYDANVTSSTGTPIPPQTGFSEDISNTQAIYCITASSTADVRYNWSGL